MGTANEPSAPPETRAGLAGQLAQRIAAARVAG